MPRRSTPTLRDAATRYIEHQFGKGGSTGQRYSQRSLLYRLAKSANDCQVQSLTPEHIETFFYGPEGLRHSCARSTLGRYYQEVKAFLTWCHRRGWCGPADNLVDGVTHTSTRVRRNRLRLSEGQMWAMVEAAPNPRDRAMLVFAMHTGTRISEIQGARVRDVNFSTGEVSVRIIKTHEEDIMSMSPILEKYLREWLTVYHELANPAPNDYLFPAAGNPGFVNGMPPDWHERGLNSGNRINNPVKIIREMAARANVDLESGDGWHTIRRSVARIFFDKASHLGHDAALRMTSAFLHHKNTSTTEIYLGLELEKVKRDEIMRVGFLEGADSGNIRSLDEYRKAD